MRRWFVLRRALVSALLLTAVVLPACALSCDGTEEPVTERTERFSAPIIITRGGVYSGRWESNDSGTPAVWIRTSEPVIIEDSVIRGRGHLIHTESGLGVHLTVRNVYGEALPPNVAGRYPGRFASVDTYRYVRIERSTMVGTSGIYLYRSVEGATARVIANVARNIDGRRADGQGGLDPDAVPGLVQFLQLNVGRSLRDSEVAWNYVVNEPYESRVEDVISLHATTGLPDDPVRVHDNFIRGAYATDPAHDGFSGGGIMLGDGGGGHQRAYDNHVVATSNYGIAIAGGFDQEVRGNRVLSCGLLPDGRSVAAQNVGIYIANLSRDPDARAKRGVENAIGWAHESLVRNDSFVPDASVWRDNVAIVESDLIDCRLEDEEEALWWAKSAAAIGVPGADTATLLGPASPDAEPSPPQE